MCKILKYFSYKILKLISIIYRLMILIQKTSNNKFWKAVNIYIKLEVINFLKIDCRKAILKERNNLKK